LEALRKASLYPNYKYEILFKASWNAAAIKYFIQTRESMLKPFFIFLLICITLSCEQKFKPIPEKKLSSMLLEMHLAESYTNNLPKDSNRSESGKQDSLNLFYASILNKNKISEKEFVKNIKWYSQNPSQFDSIYQTILANFSILQAQQDKK
jgi:hypothetical protein